MNITPRQLLAGAALVLAVCSFFVSAPVLQVAVILLAVACLL